MVLDPVTGLISTVDEADAVAAGMAAALAAAMAAHNADPTAHGGNLMPAFISESHKNVDGGAFDFFAIPATAKHFTLTVSYNGVAVPANLVTAVLNYGPPIDCAAFWSSGAQAPYGALVDIPAACPGGAVPDSIHLENKAAAGNSMDFAVRFYK
jgi:hypothetical protein